MKISRRRFTHSMAIATASLSARGWSSLARGDSPANRVRVGVIGTGVRGKYLIGNLPESARVEAICDCATSRMTETLRPKKSFQQVLAEFVRRDATHCSTHQDYRQLLDKRELDAVIIATPDHHHVQAAMLALQAGLDVYLEKPVSLTIREGRLLADAVKKTGRVLQVGSQQRSMQVNRFACEFIRDGGLGKVSRVDFPNYPGPMPIEIYGKEPDPEGLDWDLFLGPTPSVPHHTRLWMKEDFKVGELLWRGWDLFENYSGHLMTNWGGHSIDMVQYALGMDHTGPVKIEMNHDVSEAALERDWQTKWKIKTPASRGSWLAEKRMLPVTCTYSNGVTLNLLPDINEATFYGERGAMLISRNKYTVDPPSLVQHGPGPEATAIWAGEGHVARPHLQNWLECIRSRDVPAAAAEVGHRTGSICHLINLARVLNRTLHWNPDLEEFVDDPAANKLLDRPRRNGFLLPVI